MITNTIKRIEEKTIEVPLIIRANESNWVPTFDIWSTKINEDTSYIDCTQNFRSKLKNYSTTKIDFKIGHYDGNNLVIYWKALVDSADVVEINKIYSGKLRVCSWQRRYCTYFGTSSEKPWLHAVILGYNKPDYVVHHINCVSVDNRRKNLHLLPKKEHDSINHPLLPERKRMFANPKDYWRKRKMLAINEMVTQLALFITDEGRANYIAKFAEENRALTKEILEAAKIYINLSSIKSIPSKNRILNAHLTTEYLDTYEIEKHLKSKFLKSKKLEGQLKLF